MPHVTNTGLNNMVREYMEKKKKASEWYKVKVEELFNEIGG